MKFDYSELLGRMRARGYTQEKLAKEIGINECTLNSKLNNKSHFNTKEIDKICEILDISIHKIGFYFYTHKVWKSDV